MRSPRVRFAAAYLAVAIVIGACAGPAGSVPTSTDAAPPASASASVAAPTPDPTVEPLSGKLVVWDWWYQLEDNGPNLKQINAEFMKLHPNVQIEHVGQPVEQWDALFRAANAAKAGPDVAMNYGGATGVLTYGPQGALANLKDVFTPDQLAEYTAMEASARDYDLNNEIWGISMGLNASTHYYNKAMFTAAGLDPNKPPGTYDEFKAACTALKETGVIPFSQGNKDGYWAYFLFATLWGQEFQKGDAAKLAAGEIKWTDPRIKQIFQFQIDLADQGCYNDDWKGINTFFDAIDLFPAKKSAMTVALMAGQGGVDRFTEALGADGYGYNGAIEGSFVNVVPAVNYTITSYAANPKAAAAYLRYLTTTGQEVFDSPPTWNLAKMPAVDPVQQSHLDAIAKSSELAVTSHLHPDILVEISKQIIQAANGTITLDAALDAIQLKAEQVQTR